MIASLTGISALSAFLLAAALSVLVINILVVAYRLYFRIF